MNASTAVPRRGEIWTVNFSPTRGHEQSGEGPALVVSSDDYNRSPADLVVVLPITKSNRRVPWHLPVSKGTSGLVYDSVILCDHVRSVSRDRFGNHLGDATYPILEEVQRLLKYLLEIP